ncbi:MAG: serine hydrolase domain-containing protein [Candidatus Limnocylindrales bacterium]
MRTRGLELERALGVLRQNVGCDPARHAFPGAVVAVGHRGGAIRCEAMGTISGEPCSPQMTTSAIFDVASLTKVVVTTTAVLLLLQQGELSLRDPLDSFFPELASAPVGKATIAHLLTHTSGLPWIPFYALGNGWEEWTEAIAETPLVAEPGTRVDYSCTGFILLGRIIEIVAGTPLALFARDRIFGPLSLADSGYLPFTEPIPDGVSERLVMTERRESDSRGRMLEAAVRIQGTWLNEWSKRHPGGIARGAVDDENAAYMGGVAGNAGLFTTSRDLVCFGLMLLNRGRYDGGEFLSKSAIDVAVSNATAGLNDRRGLGWALSGSMSFCCDLASPDAYGHTGFTGAALLIDPRLDLVVAILTNRLQFGRQNERGLRVRRLFLNAVVGGSA